MYFALPTANFFKEGRLVVPNQREWLVFPSIRRKISEIGGKGALEGCGARQNAPQRWGRGGLWPPAAAGWYLLCVGCGFPDAPHKPSPAGGKVNAPHLNSSCVSGKGIPGSVTTSRPPPAQAAKKCGIGPRLFPVPPAESPVDGAGAQRGVKTGRRIPIWSHSTPFGAPFSLDSKNRSFSSSEKETGFEPSPPSFHVTERQRKET